MNIGTHENTGVAYCSHPYGRPYRFWDATIDVVLYKKHMNEVQAVDGALKHLHYTWVGTLCVMSTLESSGSTVSLYGCR